MGFYLRLALFGFWVEMSVPRFSFPSPILLLWTKTASPSQEGIVHGLLAVRPSVRPHNQTLKTQRKFSGGGAYIPGSGGGEQNNNEGGGRKDFFASSSDPPFFFFPLPLFVGRRTLSFPLFFPILIGFSLLPFSCRCSKNHPF